MGYPSIHPVTHWLAEKKNGKSTSSTSLWTNAFSFHILIFTRHTTSRIYLFWYFHLPHTRPHKTGIALRQPPTHRHPPTFLPSSCILRIVVGGLGYALCQQTKGILWAPISNYHRDVIQFLLFDLIMADKFGPQLDILYIQMRDRPSPTHIHRTVYTL